MVWEGGRSGLGSDPGPESCLVVWTVPHFTVVTLNRKGSPADNRYERKPLLPCPFFFAGARPRLLFPRHDREGRHPLPDEGRARSNQETPTDLSNISHPLTRRVGETLTIGNDIRVTVLAVGGNQVSLGVEAPRQVPVHREAVAERIRVEGARP